MTGAPAAAQRGQVQTVLGPIAPEALGPTLMHEHLLCDIRPPAKRTPQALGPELALDNVWAINYGTVEGAARNYLLDARDVATDEVRRMRQAGGRSVVDLSCGGLSPDPAGLVAIARATGAHVVMGCGHYVQEYQDPANATRAVEDFAEEMVAKVLISHDICYRSRLVRFGGHGYGHIFANVVPMMRRRGFSEAEIQTILVDNPRRLLTLD